MVVAPGIRRGWGSGEVGRRAEWRQWAGGGSSPAPRRTSRHPLRPGSAARVCKWAWTGPASPPGAGTVLFLAGRLSWRAGRLLRPLQRACNACKPALGSAASGCVLPAVPSARVPVPNAARLLHRPIHSLSRLLDDGGTGSAPGHTRVPLVAPCPAAGPPAAAAAATHICGAWRSHQRPQRKHRRQQRRRQQRRRRRSQRREARVRAAGPCCTPTALRAGRCCTPTALRAGRGC